MGSLSSHPVASGLEDDEQVFMVKDGVTRRGAVTGLVGAAIAPHVKGAQLAADTAHAASNYYGSAQYGGAAAAVAAGEAATAPGHPFSTDDGDGNLIVYTRTAGGSVEVARMVTSFALARTNGAEMIGASRTEPGSVYQTVMQRLNNLKLMPDDFRGAGDLNDNDAMLAAVAAARSKTRLTSNALLSYWATPSGSIRLSDKGVYTVTDVIDIISKAGFPQTASLRMFADDLGDAIIEIPSGQYFSECDERLNNLSIRNVAFTGGKGVFLQKNTGINANGWRLVDRCYFDGYTEAAIASNAADDPYWRITECIFLCDPNAPARGVALGGMLDNTVIRGNSFLRNKYHLVLGPIDSGNLHVVENDFLSFTADKVDADVVLVPHGQVGGYGTNAGMASHISNNKFGNEFLKANSPRILVSTFNTSIGDGRQNWPISSTWVTGEDGRNWLRQIQFSGNRFSFNASYAGPVIRSYVDRFDGVLFAETNTFDGGQPSHLVEWMGTRTVDRTNMNWNIKTGGMMFDVNSGLLPKIITNQPIGPIEDSIGYFGPYLSAPGNPPSGSEQPLMYATSNSDLLNFSNATKTDIAGEDGGTAGGCEVTTMSNETTAIVCPIDATGISCGRAWINVALKQGASTPITRVRLQIINFVTGVILCQRDITLPANWSRQALDFEFAGGANPASWQLRFIPLDWSSETRTKFCIGTPLHIHTGASPLRAPLTKSIVDLTNAPTAADYNVLLDILRANGLLKRS